MKKNKKFDKYIIMTARGSGKSVESFNNLMDKYGCQFGLYETMAEIEKLRADNRSLRGTCKALGEKNNNQRKELINFTRVIRNLKNELNVDHELIKELTETVEELKAEVQEANDNATWWRNRYSALYNITELKKKKEKEK